MVIKRAIIVVNIIRYAIRIVLYVKSFVFEVLMVCTIKCTYRINPIIS